ncbi:MAG: DUF2339 domain-containing protein [Phycisphaeraceae bacterium]
MELLILLIVLLVLTALLLGPAAMLRVGMVARASVQRSDALQARLDQFAAQLTAVQLRLSELEALQRDKPTPSNVTLSGASEPNQTPATPTGQAETESSLDAHDRGSPDRAAQADAVVDAGPSPEPATRTPATPSALEAMRLARQRVREDEAARAEALQNEAAEDRTPVEQPAEIEDARTDSEPTYRLSLEEVLAGKVFVWIGAVALVLTAAFLLKLGFDRDIITEPVRVIGAGAFGIALWCFGEWARRHASLVGQLLCGAAVAVLYASVLAGHNLYALFGAGWAFTLMASITAAAIVLSLRHGPGVALLGMVGGFMLPPVLGETFGGATAGMVLYLLALEVGVLAATGRRGWFGLSALTLLFTLVWSLGYVVFGDSAGERTLTALLVVGTAGAYLVQVARVHRDPSADIRSKRWALGLAIGAACSAAAVVALLVPRGGFSTREFWMLGLVAAGTLTLARLDRRYLALPFVTMGLSLLVLLAGALSLHLPAEIGADTPSLRTIGVTASAYGGLFFFGGYACLFGSPNKRTFTLMSAIAGPAYYAVVLVAGQPELGIREHWWPSTLVLAGVYGLALIPLLRNRVADHDWPIAAYALVSFGLVCVAILQGLHHPRVAVCLALMSAVAALVERRLFIRPLLIAGCVVASISAVLLVLPGPFTVDIAGVVVFNTLLPMYALPAFGFGLIAWCARRSGAQAIARGMARLTVAAVAGVIVVLTRQAFHPADFNAKAFNLYEWSAYACALMLGALPGLLIANRYRLDAVRAASVCVAGVGAAVGVIGALLPGNPLVRTDTDAGWSLVLGLAGLYVLPAWLMWLWSRRQAIDDLPALRGTLRVGAIALIAIFAGLQVRNAFHFDALHTPSVGMFECATYAVVWLVLGVCIRGVGRLNPRCPVTRRAGGAVFVVGLTAAILGNAVLLNPLWNAGSVGATPLFNGLWYLLGPSILTLVLMARRYRALDRPDHAKLVGFGAIAVGFLLTSLLVRQGFSGDGVLLLDARPGSAERYAYSLAWVLFGAALLIAGVFTRLDTLRYGSLAVLLVAVGKVFLIDTASLDNLYRVFSFFGLGVTLVGLGYLYQRLVFRRTDRSKKGPASR